jgi:sensitive to high expression protein 9
LNEEKSSEIAQEAQQLTPGEPTPSAKIDDVADNIARVPDEQLPSHRERQRWDLSKRFSEFMDELLPKLAVVTQKVNTYTGTDYSGVEALRHEIKEQGNRLAFVGATSLTTTREAGQSPPRSH